MYTPYPFSFVAAFDGAAASPDIELNIIRIITKIIILFFDFISLHLDFLFKLNDVFVRNYKQVPKKLTPLIISQQSYRFN